MRKGTGVLGAGEEGPGIVSDDCLEIGDGEPVGFVGLGRMGFPMVRRLMENNVRVIVHNRGQERVEQVVGRGGLRAGTTLELSDADIVFSMMPDLPELVDLVERDGGLLDAWSERADRGEKTVVVMSSVSPTGVVALGERVAARTGGIVSVVDAPVSGGVGGAERGELAIMVGGTREQFKRLLPLLSLLGTTVRHMGPLGAGSWAKACNQVVVGGTAAALSEALVLGELGGLDAETMLEVFGNGLAGSRLLAEKKDNLLREDYSTSGAARFMLKDLAAARDAADASGAAVPVTSALIEIFEKVVAFGLGDEDLIVVREAIRRMAGRAARGKPGPGSSYDESGLGLA